MIFVGWGWVVGKVLWKKMILRRRDDNSSPETERRKQLSVLQLGLESAQANKLQVLVNLTENRGISPDKVYDKMFNKQHEAERNNKRKRKPSKKSAPPASAPLLSARNNKRKRKPSKKSAPPVLSARKLTCEPSPNVVSILTDAELFEVFITEDCTGLENFSCDFINFIDDVSVVFSEEESNDSDENSLPGLLL